MTEVDCRVVAYCPECGSTSAAVRRIDCYYTGHRFLPGGVD